MIIKNRLWELMAIHEKSATDIYNATGISRSTLSNLKHNTTTMIQIETLEILCDYFEIQPGEFFKTDIVLTKKSEDIALGKRIKDIRSQLKMDQKTFSKRIGSTVSALSNWENGRNKPNDIMIREIAQLGHRTRDELIGRMSDNE